MRVCGVGRGAVATAAGQTCRGPGFESWAPSHNSTVEGPRVEAIPEMTGE